METKEREFAGGSLNGFLMIGIVIAIFAACLWLFVNGIINAELGESCGWHFVGAALLFICFIFGCKGYTMLEPNEAKVLTFFGKYCGTFRKNGFYWINPLMSTKNVSLRARNLNAEPIKVNDKTGNPILIGLVLVWRLKDTYKAIFDIDTEVNSVQAGNMATARMNRFERYVAVQSDAALRQVAGLYAYDDEDGKGEPEIRQVETEADVLVGLSPEEKEKKQLILEKERALQEAIKKEDYLEAAKLRDEIKAIKGEEGEQ